MFGKNLGQELKQYMRRLWPFAIPLVVISALACDVAIVQHIDPEREHSPLGMAIALFGMAGIAIIARALIHSFISFSKKLSSEQESEELSLTRLLWVPLTAFMIIMTLIMLFIFAGVSSFAWEAVGQKFLTFATEWPYFLEFLFYFIITAFTLYIIPTTWIVVFHFSYQKKWPLVLSMIVGVITLIIGFVLICAEIVLLTHTSTIMHELWVTTLSLLIITALVDVGLFLLSFHTLKSSLQKTNLKISSI